MAGSDGQAEGLRVAEAVADGDEHGDYAQERADGSIAGDGTRCRRGQAEPVDDEAGHGLSGDDRHGEHRDADGGDGEALGGDKERAARSAEALPPPQAAPLAEPRGAARRPVRIKGSAQQQQDEADAERDGGGHDPVADLVAELTVDA